MNKKYYINYGTYAGNEWVYGTLEKALEIADFNVTYTQESISITDKNNEIVAERPWNETIEYIENESNPIKFGNYGYYGDWAF